VPPSISPAGAQGGTSACRTGGALSFVSCIRLLGRLSHDLMSPSLNVNEHGTPPACGRNVEVHSAPAKAPVNVPVDVYANPAAVYDIPNGSASSVSE